MLAVLLVGGSSRAMLASARLSCTTSATRQRLNAILRRAAHSDLWTSAAKSDAHTFEDLCNLAKIRTFSNHTLHAFLPSPSTASENYSLRQRTHSLTSVTGTLNTSF